MFYFLPYLVGTEVEPEKVRGLTKRAVDGREIEAAAAQHGRLAPNLS